MRHWQRQLQVLSKNHCLGSGRFRIIYYHLFSLIMYKEIQTGLTPSIVAAFNAKLNELLSIVMHYLIKLSPEQRSAMPIVGDRRFSFVAKSFRLGAYHQNLFPTFRDYETFKRIHFDYLEMQSMVDRLRSFVEAMNDTLLQIGVNNFDTALIFYEMASAAASRDQPGTQVVYRDLARHFARINGAEEDESSTDDLNGKSSETDGPDNGPAPVPVD